LPAEAEEEADAVDCIQPYVAYRTPVRQPAAARAVAAPATRRFRILSLMLG